MKRSRRKFIRLLNSGLAVLLLTVWNKLTLTQIKASDNKKDPIPFQENKTVSFVDQYIVINQNNKVTVLSSKCTHLGCKINIMEKGLLICPCHGSRYNLEGKPEKGPAFKSLEEIPSRISADRTKIEILL